MNSTTFTVGRTRRPPPILIVGCGYVGQALAQSLIADGASVTGWVKSEETAAAVRKLGADAYVGDVSDEKSWDNLNARFNVVVHCASSGRGGAESYATVYREGLRQIVMHQATAQIIFISSTSVYGQIDGEIVTEKSPANPSTETGKILSEAEILGLAAGAVILRVAGIYGPERSVLLAKLRRGDAVIEGDGKRWINQVHRDDIVGAIRHVIEKKYRRDLFNVCDSEPVNYLTFYQWMTERLQIPMPPFGPVNHERKRGLTNKRVSNAKLVASGWSLRYPTFREGYVSLV